MLPLTLFWTILGFYTSDLKSKNLKRILIAYCSLLIILLITMCATSALIRIKEVHCTFLQTIHELTAFVHITMVTYYYAKYIVCEDMISHIYRSIDSADKCLERVGVKVSYKTEQLECAIFAFTIIAAYVVRFIYAIIFKRQLFFITVVAMI